MTTDLYVCIMAGGRGSRMRSDVPKYLHKIHGKEMIVYIIEAVRPLTDKIFVVLSPHSVSQCNFLLEKFPNLQFVIQPTPEGTGHAVQVFVNHFDGHNEDSCVLILNADTPFIPSSLLEKFVGNLTTKNVGSAVIGARLTNPKGYGRLILRDDGRLIRIEEEKDCVDKENNQCNMGIYLFSWENLQHIFCLNNHNNAHEYYLTDIFRFLPDPAHVWMLAERDTPFFQGINTPEELQAAIDQHFVGGS